MVGRRPKYRGGCGDLRGGLRDERSLKSHHIYVPNGLRPPFFALYYPHYRHIFVYPFFNSVPSRGSVCGLGPEGPELEG